MKYQILLMLLTFVIGVGPSSSSAEENLGTAKHFAISAGVGGISETVLHYTTELSAVKRIAIGTAIGSVPGLVKELQDGGSKNNGFGRRDMAADIAGALAGSALASFVNSKIHVRIQKKRDVTKVSLLFHF
jgi:uncharacterized protein YfiM (DUF2279 family)